MGTKTNVLLVLVALVCTVLYFADKSYFDPLPVYEVGCGVRGVMYRARRGGNCSRTPLSRCEVPAMLPFGCDGLHMILHTR